VTEQTLARARAGDQHAFRELTDAYRRELQLHIYRIVGSAQDAEDLLQETLLAAWRGLERFEERANRWTSTSVVGAEERFGAARGGRSPRLLRLRGPDARPLGGDPRAAARLRRGLP
jgi:RNA polymerase sigma-70 factor (ECF subfamily)